MAQSIVKFQKAVWGYYRQHKRELPWRCSEADGSFDAYKVLISEMMLQQTQVKRVIPKYQSFLVQFPDIWSLAAVPLSDVLIAWSGLGYNRRAKYLHDAAKLLVPKKTPWQIEDLLAYKGIGSNTAAAVMAYAYNQPVVFIETNIRTVFIHHFAIGSYPIADKDILPIVQQTIDRGNPREWYWALMDYGAHIKMTAGNDSRHSKHYTKQPHFAGSTRQIRGQVLRLLVDTPLSRPELEQNIADERLSHILVELEAEKLITRKNSTYLLAT